jgi:iron-sulfur cluster repair protein YtfE (RIC family)
MPMNEQLVNHTEPVEAILADHELVAEYLDHVNRMFNASDAVTAQQAAATVRRFLQYKVITHFAYEEEHLLPALLQAAPTKKVARQVARLQAEHRALQQQADQLDVMLNIHAGPGPSDPVLRKALLDFFHDLQKHAMFENNVFPALL